MAENYCWKPVTFQQELAIIQMDADAEITRSRLGAINCQVQLTPTFKTDYLFQTYLIHFPSARVSRSCRAHLRQDSQTADCGGDKEGVCRAHDVGRLVVTISY